MFLDNKEIVRDAVYSNLSIFYDLEIMYDDPVIISTALIGHYGANELLQDLKCFKHVQID